MRARVKEGIGAAATILPDGSILSLDPGGEVVIDDTDSDRVAWAESFDGLEILEAADPKAAKAAAKAKAAAEAPPAEEPAAEEVDDTGGGDTPA